MRDPVVQFGQILDTANQATEGQRSPDEAWNLIARVAAELEPHGQQFKIISQDLESLTVETDALLRRYIRYLRDNNITERLEYERRGMAAINDDDFAAFAEFSGQISEFLAKTLPLEALSAPLRKSVRPFRQGAVATQNTVEVIQKWPHVLDEDD